MNILALLVGLFIGAIGLVGVATPTGLASAVRLFLTPVGFVVIALLRVSFGVVLVLAARVSRAPTALRVLGSSMIVAGLLTPLFGVEQGRAMLDWWTAQVPTLMRLWAALVVAIGGFVVYAVAPRPA